MTDGTENKISQQTDFAETEFSITGTDAPVHRTNDNHPFTGKRDNARTMIGDRRRIEQLEFNLGHVICGNRSNLSGDYCVLAPVEGTMRCKKHQAKARGDKKPIPNPKYTMVSHVFQRCQLCRLNDCSWRTSQTGGSECAIERDLYETMSEEVTKFDKYGASTKHMFEQLVWTRVLLYRAVAQIAAEGLSIKEVTGFTERQGQIVPLTNDREHPALKHIAKLQQIDRQICDALELTPAAFTKKGQSDSERDASASIADLMKKSLLKFKSGSLSLQSDQ